MGRVLQLASFSLAEVTYTAGDIGYQVQESVRKASYTVKAKQENVSGVVLPAFEGVRSKDASGESSFRRGVSAGQRREHALTCRLCNDGSESGWSADPKM
jgi:vacuolar-type H+-ATPase subunit D/Vma8